MLKAEAFLQSQHRAGARANDVFYMKNRKDSHLMAYWTEIRAGEFVVPAITKERHFKIRFIPDSVLFYTL